LKLESKKSIKTRNSFPVGRDGMSGGGRASGGVQAKPRLWWSAADGSEPTWADAAGEERQTCRYTRHV